MKINFRVWVSILIIPLFIYAIIYLHLHSRYLIYGDEGEYMNNAWLTYMGDKPYRDFWLLFPPGEVYWPALIFCLFGVNLNIILLSNVLVTILVAGLLFLILKQLKCSPAYALIGAFLFVTQGYFVFFTLLCLASFYLLLRFNSSERKVFLLAGGFIAGLALLLRVYHVAPFCIAALSFLLMREKMFKHRIKDSLLFIGAALVPLIVALLYLWDIRSTMFYALIVDAVSHGTSMNVPYWHKMIEEWDRLLLYIDYSRTNSQLYPFLGIFIMASNFLFALFERIVPFVIIVCLLQDIISKYFQGHFAKVKIMLIVWGLFYIPYALGLSGHEHIIQAYTPFLILLYLYGYEIFSRRRNIVAKSVLVFCFIVISFNAATRLYDIYKPANSPYKLRTATGSLYIDDAGTFNTIQGIVNSIFENTKKSEYIFCLTWDTPPLYALTERRDPTYYDSPIDLFSRPAKWKEESIINDLSRTKTKLLVVERNFPIKGGMNTKQTMPLFMNYVNANYSIYKSYPHYDVYLLN